MRALRLFVSACCLLAMVCTDGAQGESNWFQPNNHWLHIRPRDETGHRTGLGTIGRSFLSHPVKTVQGIRDFSSNYNQMVKANVRGGNLGAHEQANYQATRRMGNPKLAEGISAMREQYKNMRFTTRYNNGQSRKGYGDMRTPQEVRSTMDANQRGRDRAMAEINRNRGRR